MGAITGHNCTIAILAMALVAPPCWLACQSQRQNDALASEIAELRQELAEHSASIDGMIARIDRLERRTLGTQMPNDGSDLGIDAPPAEIPPPPSQPAVADTPPLIVAVNKRKAKVGDKSLNNDALAQRFRAHRAANPVAAIVLRVASGVSSKRENTVANLARREGITQIAIVREGTAKKKKKRRKKR